MNTISCRKIYTLQVIADKETEKLKWDGQANLRLQLNIAIKVSIMS
jgi:hypothetical protein